jgi:hypothetical protein
MKLLAWDRAEKYNSVLVPRFFPIQQLDSLTYLGSFTWSNPQMGIRWLIENKAIDLWGVWQSPSEIARDYIAVKYPKRLRARKAQIELLREHRAAPLFAQRGYYYAMSYVDLKSAYWRILSAVGWDADYHPGKFLVARSSVADFPCPEEKLSRNCLVTSGLNRPLVVWTGSAILQKPIGNPHPNIGIYALCMDILHAAAQIALNCGAVYIHTDGYIVSDYVVSELIAALAEIGLLARVKERGDALIYGPGDYDIGGHKSKRRRVSASRDADTVSRADYSRLVEEYSIHSRYMSNVLD